MSVLQLFNGAIKDKLEFVPINAFQFCHFNLVQEEQKIRIANYDNNQHQPDENIRIGHLWRAIETFAAVMMMERK